MLVRGALGIFVLLVAVSLLGTLAESEIDAWLRLPNDAETRTILSHPLADVRKQADGSLAVYCHCPVPVTGADIPDDVRQALLATEDTRFETHSGVDWYGSARALVMDALGKRFEGGSTITQQLAKTIVGGNVDLWRKLREALVAREIERLYNKDQIIDLYLNRVDFGHNLTGIEQAARYYFGISARQLGLYDSAMLVGMLNAPTRLDPIENPAAAAARAEVVLSRMVAAGYIDLATAQAASASGITRGTLHPVDLGVGHYLAWLAGQLDPQSAADHHLVLSIDLQTQIDAKAAMDDSLSDSLKLGASEAALIAVNGDGDILAHIGGRDFATNQVDHATTARRQIGSTFKPFIYLTALAGGIAVDSTVDDSPVAIGNWRPRDFDGRFLGRLSLTEALAQSRNAAAVSLAERVGLDKVRAMAARFGLPTSASPAFLLGATAASAAELVAAYATLAAGGEKVVPRGTVMVLDPDGSVVNDPDHGSRSRIIDPVSVGKLNPMLMVAAQHSLGKVAGSPTGKSGTSNDGRDAWFVGSMGGVSTAVWMGNDDDSPTSLAGGTVPARVWLQVMTGR